MKQLLYLFLLLLPLTLCCQDERYEDFIPKFKSEILSASSLENNRLSRTLRDLTFTGALQELYEMDAYVDTALTAVFGEVLKEYKVVDAKEYILSKTAAESIVIINESHHRPEHRQFTKSFLQELYGQGYRYLALEAIFSNVSHAYYHYPENKYFLGDTTILTRGYPLMKSCSGTYVKEPAFGNMIRTAIELGFTIIGYEAYSRNREWNQANNIARVYEYDPEAKIVIHCGYGHLIESSRRNSNGKIDTFMAGYLKEMTGINPYTIDQTAYYNVDNVNEAVFAHTDDHSPQVLLKEDLLFKSHKGESQGNWDMTVFHAPITFIEDRPAWLVQNETYKVFEPDLQQITIHYPVRIKLLSINDRLDAVPIDVMEIEHAQAHCKLYGDIEKGKFVVENKNGDRQILYML